MTRMVHRWAGTGALLFLLALGSATAPSAAHAQPAPPLLPEGEQWFDALNAGDLLAMRALMLSEGVADPDAAGAPVPRCAGGCGGMDAIEAGIAAMVADGYWGAIDPTSVLVLDGLVSFDVIETAGVLPAYPRITQWTMALEGELLAPACTGVCLRSPAARAALLAAQPPAAAGATGLSTAVPPRAGAGRLVALGDASPPAETAARGVAGPTPAPWLLGAFVAALLLMVVSLVASAVTDGWRAVRRRG